MLLRTSFVCLLLILYMGALYFSGRHLPIRATRIFTYYYISEVILVVFDLITLYTVNHIEQVSPKVNDGAHLIYLVVIAVCVFLNFLYLRSFFDSRIQLFGWIRWVHCLPLLLVLFLIPLLPIEYIHGVHTNYSAGAKVYVLYISIIFYNIASLYYCIRYWGMVGREKRSAIIASVSIFTVSTVIDILMPEALLPVVYVVLSSVGLMMSSENGEKYLDKQTGMFNQYALGIVTSEHINYGKATFCTVITMTAEENMLAAIDWKLYVSAMETIQRYCRKNLKCALYRACDNGFVLLSGTEQAAEKMAKAIIEYAAHNLSREISYGYEIIEIDKHSGIDEMMSQIAEVCINSVNRMAIYDYLTGLYNRNCFEKDIQQLKKEKRDLYYFIADLNDLKETNDILGHSAGDDLLQSLAELLRNAVGQDGKVYRQGGDEFAILWQGSDASGFLEKLEMQRCQKNKKRMIPISFAIGYGRILDADGMRNADLMMYEHKKEIKAPCNKPHSFQQSALQE